MRRGEMLTAAQGAGATPSTNTAAASSAAAAAELVRAAGTGGNFPLAVALLAFAIANFINLVAIWCALPALPIPLVDLKSPSAVGPLSRCRCRSRWLLRPGLDRLAKR
jgi:hypothetical protein